MKKFLLVLICLIFIVTGCKPKQDDKLVFASWGSKTEVQILKDLISDFEKENPDIKVEFLHIPQNYFQKLHLMFASNLAPDVIFINNLNIPVYEKYLLDLNEIIKNKEDYYPQVLDTMTYENRLLAIPRDVSTLVVFYNKDLFDKNNIPYPNENWNITDFLNTAKKLTNHGVYGISFEENSLFYLPYMRAFEGGILSSTGEQIMNSENSQKGIQFYSDLRNKYNVAPKKYQSASETMAQMFINGRLAMHLSGRWLVPKYREDIKFDWDIINFPNVNGKSSVTLDSSGYAITKTSKHKAEAVKLVEFLSSDKAIQKFTTTGLIVPARIDTINSSAFLDNNKPKNAKVFVDVIKNSEKTPVNKHYKEITDKLDEQLNYSFNE